MKFIFDIRVLLSCNLHSIVLVVLTFFPHSIKRAYLSNDDTGWVTSSEGECFFLLASSRVINIFILIFFIII